MSSHISCLRSPTSQCIYRVLIVSTHIVITIVLQSVSSELAITKHKESKVFILQREVDTHCERSTEHSTFTKIDLILAVNSSIVVHILVFQITRLDITTDHRCGEIFS